MADKALLYVPRVAAVVCVVGIVLAASLGQWSAVAVLTLLLVVSIAVSAELNRGGWS